MENKSSDLSAKLLATENLSVVRAKRSTASFDVKNRVLTLPMWKDMTPEIEDMLVGHEVGHALYTTEEYFDPIKEDRKMMGYMNVLEDVRIEKLIKRKYPGLRKRMNEGYKQLNDRDFFGVKQVQAFDDLLLIDKINLYYKAGFQCGVTFTSLEKPFVIRAEKTETPDEVITLAKEIFEFSKQQMQEKKERLMAEDLEEDEEEDFDDMDIDWDDLDEENEQEDDHEEFGKDTSSGRKSNQVSDEELESKTERNFAKKLEELADSDTEYHYHEFDTNYLKSPIVGYKNILNETKDSWGDSPEETMKERKAYDSFKDETMRAVNYLVKEFEMRKSAQMYKRAQISKSGSLDMKRIWSYKLQDDLFKRVTVLPQGKNHGMLFLLDWSGSMDGVIQDTLKQVINLAMFCNRIQIPYRVLAFTTQYDEPTQYGDTYNKWTSERRAKHSTSNVLSNIGSNFHMLELFSNKMTSTEFNTMARRVINHKFQWNAGYGMGGTPLNEALVWVYLNLGEYIKNNSIEKMTLITLTDGDGGALYSSQIHAMKPTAYIHTDNNQFGYQHVKQKHFIRDDQTQKTYELTSEAPQQTETILRMIKDRYGIMSVGFYICHNTRRNLECAIKSNLPSFTGDVYSQIESWRKEFRDNGFSSLKNTGRDDLFLIPQTATKIEEGELNVKADANAKSIAKNFTKFLNTKKTSRVLLNRFVGYVA
jgi:hypothetical protein